MEQPGRSPRGVPTMAMVEAATDAWNRAEDRPGGRGPIVGASYVSTVNEMLTAALAVLLNDGYRLVAPDENDPHEGCDHTGNPGVCHVLPDPLGLRRQR